MSSFATPWHLNLFEIIFQQKVTTSNNILVILHFIFILPLSRTFKNFNWDEAFLHLPLQGTLVTFLFTWILWLIKFKTFLTSFCWKLNKGFFVFNWRKKWNFKSSKCGNLVVKVLTEEHMNEAQRGLPFSSRLQHRLPN